MKTPFFSIIIPTLNEEGFIGRLLDTLVMQTFADFEVIVSDGYSKDRTKQVVESYKKKFSRVTFITSKKRNISHQRNTGARAARGMWLIFLDADGMLDRNAFLYLHTYISRHKAFQITPWYSSDSNHLFDRLWVGGMNIGMEVTKAIGRPAGYGQFYAIRTDVFSRSVDLMSSLSMGKIMRLWCGQNNTDIHFLLLDHG